MFDSMFAHILQVDTAIQMLMGLLTHVQARGRGDTKEDTAALQQQDPKAQAVVLLLKLLTTGCLDACRGDFIVRARVILINRY
jgi:hypothetical protein